MRYAIEKDGFTLNIILADDAAVATLIATQQAAQARPLAEGEQPPLPYPSVEPMPLPAPSCTPRQARLALAGAGLLTAVEEFVAASDAAIQIEWQYASEIKRDWPPVLAFAEKSGISDAQLDALFALAASL